MRNSIQHKFIASLIIIAASSFQTLKADRYEEYINLYSPIAVEQMEEFHIPASITLAQGLLESGAGKSPLAIKGNNHFGIKCHKTWKGKTMLRNDDAPNECFRVYGNAAESYRDHSLFLQGPRYSSLYDLEASDYAGWARGLSRCGYATDPNYADKLVAIIERYGLYGYDGPGGASIEETIAYIRETLSQSHPIKKSHGLHYIVAFPGDTYAAIAKEFGLKEKKLKEYNDAGKSKTIKEWEEVYLEPKREIYSDLPADVTIGDGESMRSISQRYGIKLKEIKRLNKKAKDRPGTILRLK